jgi:hypothetical protein
MVFLRPSSPRTFINNFLSASLIIYFLEMLGVESLRAVAQNPSFKEAWLQNLKFRYTQRERNPIT